MSAFSRIALKIGLATSLAAFLAGCGGGVSGGSGAGPFEFDADLPKPLRLSRSRHRRLEISGTVRLARGRRQWRQIRLDQGDRGRRPSRRTLQANWEAAKLAGIPRGAYHFVYWCRPPIEEVSWFEQNVPVEDDALPPVLDVESDSEIEDLPAPSRTAADRRRHEGDAGRNGSAISASARSSTPSVDFYQAILSDGAFADYPMWVRSTKHHPSVRYGDRDWRVLAIPGRRSRRGASRAASTATCSTERRRNGRRFWTGHSRARPRRRKRRQTLIRKSVRGPRCFPADMCARIASFGSSCYGNARYGKVGVGAGTRTARCEVDLTGPGGKSAADASGMQTWWRFAARFPRSRNGRRGGTGWAASSP